MSRLFLRLYLGVLFILFAAWSVQFWLTVEPTDESNASIVEDAMGGGVRLALLSYEAAEASEEPRTLELIQQQFAYPVAIVPREDLPLAARDRLNSSGDVQFAKIGSGLFLIGQLNDPTRVMLFGPLPQVIRTTRSQVMLGLAIVLAFAAAAIVILLRPLNQQLAQLERTTRALAGGALNQRVEETRAGTLQNVARAVNQLANRIQSLLKTQQELMQGVSHELKTPLSRIQFAIELLQSETDAKRISQRIQVIQTASHELEEMVNRLLQYVRTDAPRSATPNWRVPLEPIIQQVFDAERLMNAPLQYEVDPRIMTEQVAILSNVNDLTCVISNTVRNASRFAEEKIRISAYRTANGTIIDVDDDGPGIPEKNREAVFRPFERLADDRGSAGLGLALVGRIMAKHGGWVKAESSQMGGCRIRTFWPRSKNAADPNRRDSSGSGSVTS